MSDELATYREQLQQVQAALSSDPENKELIKLEEDLKEMIALSSRLVHGSRGSAQARDGGSLAHAWKVGDECEAVWSSDGKYYKAKIATISEDRTSCTVLFEEYGSTETVSLSSLRSLDASEQAALKGESVRKHALESSATDHLAAKRTKNLEIEKRKAKKEKLLKRQQAQAEVDTLQKQDQSKWKSFSSSGTSKSPAFTKKSIFATPDGPDGKVGHGTCGVGGKGMTDYQQRGKWQFNKDE